MYLLGDSEAESAEATVQMRMTRLEETNQSLVDENKALRGKPCASLDLNWFAILQKR